MSNKPPSDPNVAAFQAVQRLTGQISPLPQPEPPRQKNPHAQALAALGASKGGKARAASLSAAKRKQIAQEAARARWHDKGKA
jgi:hypothetical protein